MYREERKTLIEVGENKINYLKENTMGYLISAMFAGMFVGLGALLSLTVGSYLDGTPTEKIGMGLAFPIALSLVIMGKAELFTSSTFILSMGMMQRRIRTIETVKALLFCYIGNWAGALILALLFLGTGAMDGTVGKFVAEISEVKIHYTILQLITKGILCNILVCLVIWCANRMKSETAKLILVFWCLFALITNGFEHSIANMTTLTLGLFRGHGFDITLMGYLYNIFWVTIGNIIAGVIFIALPYFIIVGKEKID